jgi:YHS domain-containing protein
VVSFIFADLIVLPILDIYRKYYGGRAALYILATFYLTMAAAGYVVEILFSALRIIPSNRNVEILTQGPSWNYTSVLNFGFLILAVALLWRFFRTGGPEMLAMMEKSAEETQHMTTDPVCGMQVDPQTARERREYGGRTFYFCSAGCRERFEQNPDRYLDQLAQEETAGKHAHHGH